MVSIQRHHSEKEKRNEELVVLLGNVHCSERNGILRRGSLWARESSDKEAAVAIGVGSGLVATLAYILAKLEDRDKKDNE